MRLDWARERFADPRYTNDIASIKDAEHVLNALIRSTRTRYLLHADLQAKNVLTGHDNRWFAIDPFGAVGDLNAEAALWAAIQDGPTSIEDRLLELDGTLLDPDRLRAWTFVFAVAEYRPYLPEPARRIEEFLTNTDGMEILSLITGSKPKPRR
jgi:streptomycin 6-kinase